jgi:catechol 2,3-dioxygenase-like lactoylglutathione lyase family enzyme
MLFAGVPVADFGPGVAWYERFFGRPADVVVHENEVMWQVAQEGWVYVVRDPDRAGNGLFAIFVDDLDGMAAEYGLEIETVREGMRKTVLVDPEGNRITLGQRPAQ